MAGRNGKDDRKLPYCYQPNVLAGNRVRIPTHLKFIEEGDFLEGYVEAYNNKYPFKDKQKVNVGRNITIGYIKPFLPKEAHGKLPKTVKVCIEGIKGKSIQNGPDDQFNLIAYKPVSSDYNLIFQYKGQQELGKLDFKKKNAGLISAYYTQTEAKSISYPKEKFEDSLNLWIQPVLISLYDDFGAKIPVIVYLIMSTTYYQKSNEHNNKILTLFERFLNWALSIEDFNKSNLAKLSEHIEKLLNDEELLKPQLLPDILKMGGPDKDILQLAIKEHRNGGIEQREIYRRIQDYTNLELDSSINRFVSQGYLRKIESEGKIYIDTTWLL